MATIFADGIFQLIFLYESYHILFHNSLKFVSRDVIENITLKLRQNGSHYTGAIFKCIFLNENI